MQNTALPIDLILPQLTERFAKEFTLILQAEPGAGKTTRVPLALMEQDYIDGKILLLEPRRVAARSAAQFMADSINERVGQRIGYSMRMERKVSSETRVEVITEGLLARRILADPELSGVSMVIFDEFHERSIHTDLGLALCREVAALRDAPLRLLMMSATLDTAALRQKLDNAPVLSCAGRSFGVTLHKAKTAIHRHQLIDELERRCRSALQQPGDVLVFLPGRAEIHQLQSRLDTLTEGHPELSVIPLYSGVDDARLKQLFTPTPAGSQRMILATSIAQTSITLPSVSCVIDSGLERRPKYDPGLGLSRLTTQRISAATATQRAGRAGRTGPGLCYQLWSAEQQNQLRDHDSPQITEIDLSDTLLTLLSWGIHTVSDLEWLEPPPTTLWQAAIDKLKALDAIELHQDTPKLTPTGKQMVKLPTDARTARLLIAAQQAGAGQLGAQLAALITEPPRLQVADIELALDLFNRNRQQRLARLAERFARLIPHAAVRDVEAAQLLLPAYADRIAERIDPATGRFRLCNGTGVRLDPADPLCRSQYLICIELGGRDDQAELRLTLGASISKALIISELHSQIRCDELLLWEGDHLRALQLHRLGKLELERTRATQITTEARATAWCQRIVKEGVAQLPNWTNLTPWLARLRYLAAHQAEAPEPINMPDLSDTALTQALRTWLAPALGTIKQRSELSRIDLKSQLMLLLPWQITQWLEQYVPATYQAPSGRKVEIDYQGEIPRIAIKLQEMFGLQTTPTTGLGQPIRVELLSPAGRPLAMTTDILHFWQQTYPEVRKENRGRYAKHPWPEDPLSAVASHLTNAALRRKATE